MTTVKPPRPRAFGLLTFTTYMPLPILGIMIIFGLMGKWLHIGWLESAPGVLNIPLFLAYTVALFMGAIYGVIKNEKAVYRNAFISLGLWVLLFGISFSFDLPRNFGYFVSAIFGAALLVFHLLQYVATKKWESHYSEVE